MLTVTDRAAAEAPTARENTVMSAERAGKGRKEDARDWSPRGATSSMTTSAAPRVLRLASVFQSLSHTPPRVQPSIAPPLRSRAPPAARRPASVVLLSPFSLPPASSRHLLTVRRRTARASGPPRRTGHGAKNGARHGARLVNLGRIAVLPSSL